jgi:DNA invertase Pin-like site-specific DNA recombinase
MTRISSETMIPVVLYASKSSPDEKGSTDDQLGQIRGALPQDREVIGEFSEENVSGYHGNRGPELEAAIATAIEAAENKPEHEDFSAELWVFHSSRLARGSGRKAQGRSLMKIYADLREQGVQLRSVEDDAFLTNPMLVGVASETAHKYSADLAAHTRRGIRQKQAEGRPFGAVLTGYRPTKDIVEGKVITRRVVDPEMSVMVERAFRLFDEGYTPREIGEILNREGARGRRGGALTSSRIRRFLKHRGYLGEQGYPRMPWMTDELFERVQKRLAERGEYYQQHGGRSPTTKEYLLRGLCRCGACGAKLHVRRGKYVCGNRNMRTGLCDADPIRADVLESAVLTRMRSFVGDLEDWIRDQLVAAQEHRGQLRRAADHARRELEKVDRRIERAQRHYDQALDGDDDRLVATALRELARLDEDRGEKMRNLDHAEAQVEEWTGEPDADEARKWLQNVIAEVEGRIARAEGADAVRAAIRVAVEDINVSAVEDDKRYLLIDITLRGEALPSIAVGGDPDEIADVRRALLGLRGGFGT